METNPSEQMTDSQESFPDIWSQFLLDDTMVQIVKDCENAAPTKERTPLDVTDPIIKKEIKDEPPPPLQPKIVYKAPFLSMEKYPGPYGFDVHFPAVSGPVSKCIPHTYSHDVGKWFVKMGAKCPVNLVCVTPPPQGTVVRAVPVFNQPENMMDIVTRCENHKMQDNANHSNPSHLIRADMPADTVTYSDAVHGRENVIVPFQNTPAIKNNAVILYQFMCNSSCPSINRKPLSLVMTLEMENGDVLGRCVIDMHISSCPGRDRASEEDKAKSTGSKTQTSKKKSVSKRKREVPKSGDDDVFYLEIKGREKYELLKKMKTALDLQEYVSPELKEKYYSEEKEWQNPSA